MIAFGDLLTLGVQQAIMFSCTNAFRTDNYYNGTIFKKKVPTEIIILTCLKSMAVIIFNLASRV